MFGVGKFLNMFKVKKYMYIWVINMDLMWMFSRIIRKYKENKNFKM